MWKWSWFGVLISACATLPGRSGHPDLSIVLTAQRQLELEPCGCTANPLGGVAREARLVASWEQGLTREAIRLSVGPSFVPPRERFHADRLDLYRLKASFLVKALRALRTTAVGLTADDAALGVEALRSLETEAGFPFLATNLISTGGAPTPFVPALPLRAGQHPVWLLALSAPPRLPAPEVIVRDPAEAIAGFLANVREVSPGLVILSNLSDSDQRALQLRFPQIRLWLGKDQPSGWVSVESIAPQALRVTPLDRGRSVSRLNVWWPEAADGEWRHSSETTPLDSRLDGDRSLLTDLVESLAAAVRQKALR